MSHEHAIELIKQRPTVALLVRRSSSATVTNNHRLSNNIYGQQQS